MSRTCPFAGLTFTAVNVWSNATPVYISSSLVFSIIIDHWVSPEGQKSTFFSPQTVMASSPPHNFSWVEPKKLAGLAMPRMPSEYRYLLDNGVRHLVCLCERKPPNHDTCPELQLHHIKIADFTPPSPGQIDQFLSIVEGANSKGEVGAHITTLEEWS